MAQPESKLSRAIKNAIRGGGGYCIKIHGGPTMEAGTPDLLACIPCEVWTDDLGQLGHEIIGRFVGIETKMPDPRSQPSEIQLYRHDQIKVAGGVVIVARSVQQVLKELDALGWVRGTTRPLLNAQRGSETP